MTAANVRSPRGWEAEAAFEQLVSVEPNADAVVEVSVNAPVDAEAGGARVALRIQLDVRCTSTNLRIIHPGTMDRSVAVPEVTVTVLEPPQ